MVFLGDYEYRFELGGFNFLGFVRIINGYVVL